MASIKGNYKSFSELKSDLGVNGSLDFYDNDKSIQCWVTTTEIQVCITCPEDIDPSKSIVVQSSIREFTIEKKKGQKFMALWVFNGTTEGAKEVKRSF